MIISDFSDTTRFVFACNDSTKLIEPIQSRCAILRFTKLTDEAILSNLERVIQIENILHYDSKGLEALIFTSEGDMRTAINNLQSTITGYGKLDEEGVFRICDVPDIKLLKIVSEAIQKADYQTCVTGLQKLWDLSYTAYDIVNNLGKIVESSKCDTDLLFELVNELTNLKMRILQGLPSFLQIAAAAARMCEISRKLNQTKRK